MIDPELLGSLGIVALSAGVGLAARRALAAAEARRTPPPPPAARVRVPARTRR
jgi:hypothetical protein